jgi:hypothetical protein
VSAVGAQTRSSERKRPSHLTFGCLSGHEADLIAEVEVHVCAALRHLARASEQEAAAARAARLGPGASRGRVGFEVPSLTCNLDEGSGCELSSAGSGGEESSPSRRLCGNDERSTSNKVAANDSPTPTGSTRAGGSESAFDGGDSSASGTAHGPAFAVCFERLVEVAWAFYLRVQLLNSLLRGDALESAAWSVRFLGLAEPWGLRRVQELALHGLELTVDILQVAQGQKAIEFLDSAWHGLREACVAYLGAPVIPRLDARLKRSVSTLTDLGLQRKSTRESKVSMESAATTCQTVSGGDTEEPESATASNVVNLLEQTLEKLLGPDGNGIGGATGASPPRQFDEKGRGLRAFRASDSLHTAFRRALVEAAAGHPDGKCHLDPQNPALLGAEVAALFNVDKSWSKERLSQLREVISTMPLALSRQLVEQVAEASASESPGVLPPKDVSHPAGLEHWDLEPGGLDEGSDEGRDGLLFLDEVTLDVESQSRLGSKSACSQFFQGAPKP